MANVATNSSGFYEMIIIRKTVIVEFGAVQKRVNLVNIEKCRNMRLRLQNPLSIQRRIDFSEFELPRSLFLPSHVGQINNDAREDRVEFVALVRQRPAAGLG